MSSRVKPKDAGSVSIRDIWFPVLVKVEITGVACWLNMYEQSKQNAGKELIVSFKVGLKEGTYKKS